MRVLLFNAMMDADDTTLGFATLWIQTLAARVDTIDVVTMQAGRIEVPENVRVYSIGKEKGYSEPRRAFEFYRILLSLVNRHRYDACFVHMIQLFVNMAFPVLCLKKVPIVLWYAHGAVSPSLRVATLFVDSVVTSSEEGFRIPSHKKRVIGQGIETERFVPKENKDISKGPFTILSLGRLSPVKRVELLIEAIARLSQEKAGFAVHVEIVGGPVTEKDQEYVAGLKRQVEQHHLQDIVVFRGRVPFPEIVPHYQQADCFVDMSETGSLDKTVLEAMSCGVPVIVNPAFTAVLGATLAETWVIERDVEILCDRLLRLASMSKTERLELGEQLRAIVVSKHGLTQLCDKIVSELRSVMLKK